MKNLQKGFIIPIVIVIALAVIGGVVYVFTKDKGVPDPVVQSSEETDVSADSIEAMKDWNTYNNPQSFLFFQYPSDWYVSETSQGTMGKITALSVTDRPFPSPELEPLPIKIQIQYHDEKSPSVSLKDIASAPSELDGRVPKVEQIKIFGVDGFRTNEIGDATYYIPKSPTEYLVVFIASNSADESVKLLAKTIGIQIMSTVKVIN